VSWSKEQMAERAARELRDGDYVNLGIGLPTLVANAIPAGIDLWLQSENGLIGIGPPPFEDEVDPDLIDAAKQTVTLALGASICSSSVSFAMIRGGHMDVTILGAMEVSQEGDLANWMIPGKLVKGMGGAMDLVAGAKRVIVLMEHRTRDGRSKLLPSCTLPLTGRRVVHLVITELGVFGIGTDGFEAKELAPGVSFQQAREATDGHLYMSTALAAH
jgi:3-oxoacid CoA-transferase subunit B